MYYYHDYFEEELSSISLDDLIIAYRKSKVDCYYENGHLTALNYAVYENSLITNLKKLQQDINNGQLTLPTASHAYIVKSIEPKVESSDMGSTQVYYSNTERAWDRFKLEKITFRIIGQLPVDFHIISSLWIEKVGSKLEENLSNNSYGCRLKRKIQYQSIFVAHGNSSYNEIDPMELGHFRPYISDYKRWQAIGLSSIEDALNNNEKVVVITADIAKFYHRIDPSFLLDEQFSSFIGHHLTKEQRFLTELLVNQINTWSKDLHENLNTPDYLKCNGHCGIPVGLSASKVIANLILAYLDYKISTELSPRYYGRYVDDIFIVLSDNGTIRTSTEFWTFVEKRIAEVSIEGSKIEFKIPYAGRSQIEFGSDKEKLFILEGSSGDFFINTVKEALQENSSEWRMLPESESDLDQLARQITKASSDNKESVNGLRKSDGISIQRLKFALRLRNFESAVELLPEAVWKKGLERFLDLVYDFILVPDKLDTYSSYHPRIIKLAIRSNQPSKATKLWNRIDESWTMLSNKNQNIPDSRLLEEAHKYHTELLKEAVYSSLVLTNTHE